MIYILLKISRGILPVLILLVGYFPAFTHAQEVVSFSVSPAIFDMTANPGQTWRSSLRVINANPFDLTVSVEVVSFVPKGEGGTPRFIPIDASTPPNSTLAQWISTDSEILIKAEQTTELPLNISVPSEASPGGQFAAILVSTKSTNSQSENTKVETSQVISSLIFLRVSGDVIENSTIRSFKTTDYILNKPAATFELRIENKGNVHIQPQGEIKILNMWGQERGIIPVNQQTLFGNVLPQSFRKYTFSWEGRWAISDIGRYTAEATLVYGQDKKQFMTAETTFWLVPWKILLLILVFLCGFFTLISWAIRLYIRKMLTLAGISNPTHTTLELNTRSSRASVTAPIEAGILDLRARFNQTDSKENTLTIIGSFVRSYWRFFTTVVAIIAFVAVVVWFVKGANEPTRDFNVSIESDGRNVKISSDTPVMNEDTASPVDDSTTVAASSTSLVKIVNRSGSDEAGASIKKVLQENGYKASSVENDLASLEKKTVVVFPPSLSVEAKKLSELLGDALLSSFTGDSTSTIITIYAGTDAINLE